MSRKSFWTLALALMGFALSAEGALAATRVVGPAGCQAGFQHYPTIQAAVNSANAGDTVLVCPGTYPEQVVINSELTLMGVAYQNSSLAMITPPSGGLAPNVTLSVGLVAAQLVVQNAPKVTLANLTLDGTGSGCGAPAAMTAGLVFLNAGTSSRRSSIGTSVIRNQNGGCGVGNGILMQDSNVDVVSSLIHYVEDTQILQIRGNSSIKENTLATGGNWGIRMSNVDGSTIVLNTIDEVLVGVYLNGSKNVVVTGNGMRGVANGVGLDNGASNNTLLLNKIASTSVGMWLENVSNNTVNLNVIVSAFSVGFVDRFSLGGNKITYNRVNEGHFGIWVESTGNDVIANNTLVNVIVQVTTQNPNTQ
jgi:nitrous oxidase accessory protein